MVLSDSPSEETPESWVRAMGCCVGRGCTVCVCVCAGSLTGRGHGLLGTDYCNEWDNGACVCVCLCIDLYWSMGIYNAVSKSS